MTQADETAWQQLTDAVNNMATNVTNATGEISTLTGVLETYINGTPGTTPPEVTDAISRLNAMGDQLGQAVASAQAAVPPSAGTGTTDPGTGASGTDSGADGGTTTTDPTQVQPPTTPATPTAADPTATTSIPNQAQAADTPDAGSAPGSSMG